MPAARPRVGLSQWGRRIAWLIAIWGASVAALAVVALALKGIMQLAGMSS